jgi:hypothetical protein
MTWWHRLWRRGKMEEQLEKELRFHLDRQTTDLIAQGLDPDEAQRQARLALGGPEPVKEQCRNARGTRWLEDLWQDLRYAVRRLRGKPGFTAVGVVTLALGIGASTAISSVVNPILLEPLPYPQAGRLMMIWDIFEGRRSDVTSHTDRELVERSRSFDAMAVMEAWQPTMTGPAQPERLDGQSVSYFRSLGVSPALGRDFQASDDRYQGPKVAILSDALWRRRFALILFEVFGIVALVLAATGIYGVLSGSVTERMREIGVRSALGASRADILALVVRQGMTLTGLGVAIGLVGAVAASSALVTLLFGVSRLDAVTHAGVILLLASVSAIACSVPAWRAARVDPLITLRAE